MIISKRGNREKGRKGHGKKNKAKIRPKERRSFEGTSHGQREKGSSERRPVRKRTIVSGKTAIKNFGGADGKIPKEGRENGSGHNGPGREGVPILGENWEKGPRRRGEDCRNLLLAPIIRTGQTYKPGLQKKGDRGKGQNMVGKLKG